ncbi:AAA family ATPase [Hwanghaeella sp.]|uniref:AAA family ATPase n=1 Tax=Hwanghaeella sp. TaxID=2605943 RepID=UPI003CCBE1C4
MSFVFRDATLTEAKPLIGIYAESGKGKTYSALLLARGFAGPNGKVGMIETEAGRGEAYADMIDGGYQVLSLRNEFSPKAYGEAIKAAEKAGFDALIIDSASHEWEGAGGVLSMAAENQERGKRGPIVWQKPKMEHARNFMLPIMQTSIPLVIVCMRAKYPMKEVPKPNGGKEWVRLETLEPKQADDILYEMFVHGWIDDQHRFRGTKYTRKDLRDIIRDGEPISLDTGRRLAEWTRGMATASTQQQSQAVERFLTDATEAAQRGTAALTKWVGENKAKLPPGWLETHKRDLWRIGEDADKAAKPADPPPADDSEDLANDDDPILTVGEIAAAQGTEALEGFFTKNADVLDRKWMDRHERALRVKAAAADRPKEQATEQPAQAGLDV